MTNIRFFYAFFVLTCLALFIVNPVNAQWVEGRTSDGFILPDFKRPVIEARILNEGGSSAKVFYPGITRNINIHIENTGSKRAENCRASIESESPYLRIRTMELSSFSLEPGESKRISVRVEVLTEAPVGSELISVIVDEENGYNMFPARNLNIYIEESPEYELVVTDMAIRDQWGMSYFEQFQDVEIFFRIQNCSFETYDDVKAQIKLHHSLSAKQVNPNYSLGTLKPGEYKDIRAVVQTTFASTNISLDIHMQYDDKTAEQNMVLEYRITYKKPDEMTEEGCSQFVPALTDQVADDSKNQLFSPLERLAGKYAIVIGNQNYFTLDNLEVASNDAREFANFLINYLGYEPGNIVLIPDILMHNLRDLDSHHALANLKRSIRRRMPDKELTFYYVGYGSVDLYHGDVYLLPSNFTPVTFTTRININEIYDFLNQWKNRYNFSKVSAYFNIIYAEKSLTGNKKDDEFSYVSLQKNYPGITTLKASSHHHSSHALKDGELTLFTSLFMQAMKGAADLNNDGRITSFELYRYISDEFQGLPAHAREKYDTYSVPVFFGEDIIIY